MYGQSLLASAYYDFYWLILGVDVNDNVVLKEMLPKVDDNEQHASYTKPIPEVNNNAEISKSLRNVFSKKPNGIDIQNTTRNDVENVSEKGNLADTTKEKTSSITAVTLGKSAEHTSSSVKIDCTQNTHFTEEKEDKFNTKGYSDALRRQPSNVTPTTTNHLNPISPKGLISVFGLESSGTRLLTKAISVASGAAMIGGLGGFHGRLDRYKKTRGIEVQHLSLPFGGICEEVYRGPSVIKQSRQFTLSVLTPRECGVSDENSWDHTLLWDPSNKKNSTYIARSLPQYCHNAGLGDFMRASKRFFVNVTSHMCWYLDRGVQATAVLVLRDKTIQIMSKVMNHCPS